MKKKQILQIVLFTILSINNGYCQFVTNSTILPNYYGETDNSQKIEAIGIGDYTNVGAQPNAALDITIPYLYVNSPGLIYPGEAIRSSAEKDYNHTWKMFTFPETEKFHVLNPKNSDDIHLNVLQRGNMDFYTSNTHWMQLLSNGNLGLSNDEWSLFSPDEQLHQNNKESADLWHHFTNKTTGLGGNKGFKLGLFGT